MPLSSTTQPAVQGAPGAAVTRIIKASVSIDRLEGGTARRECRASQEKMPLSSTT
jgi:hypothetical protein